MDTYQRLISVCSAVFEGEINIGSITTDSNLREDLGINSIGLLYMALAVEEEFGIKFVNEDFADIQTVKDVIAVIEKKVS